MEQRDPRPQGMTREGRGSLDGRGEAGRAGGSAPERRPSAPAPGAPALTGQALTGQAPASSGPALSYKEYKARKAAQAAAQAGR
jgi:hypothetical protein